MNLCKTPYDGAELFIKACPGVTWALCHRRQPEEFRRSEGQVRLLGQGPLGAVAAGGRHDQDPVQERSQRVVERRSVRPGEKSTNSTPQTQRWFLFHFF